MQDYDEIDFSRIKSGDVIRMIRTDDRGARTYVYDGTAQGWSLRDKWWNMTGDWSACTEELSRWRRSFYRKRFIFPEKFGSVIQGKYIPSSNPRVYDAISEPVTQFVLCQKDMWRNELGNGFSTQEVKDFFTEHKVLREGI
jgi:hypothetical protein